MMDMHDAVDMVNERLDQVAEVMGISELELSKRVTELNEEDQLS